MVTVRTQIGIVESARRHRVEPTGNIVAVNVQRALEGLDAAIRAITAGARPQRSITSSSDLPITTSDSILNCNLAAPLTITVPSYLTRNGISLTFKDVGRSFASNNVTLNRTGSDTFDGLTTVTLNVNAQEFTLIPFTDGVNSGYSIG